MSGPTQKPASPAQEAPVENPYAGTPWTSTRSLKQLGVFVFGAACFIASTQFTRRAVYKRSLRKIPKYFTPNTNPHEHFSPFHDALQALNLATMNCVSVGIMMVGGALWSVDISGLKELQTVTRNRLDYDAIYATDDDDDEEDMPEESLKASILRKREEAGTNSGRSTPR